ncbi:MAG TPA: 2-hydroxychromene-2-carboxylate isomerase [Methylovirgula sp.]
MSISIEYFFSCLSTWSYVGHAAFIAIAKKHALTVVYRPMPIVRLFSETGGLPALKRHSARQEYRLIELQRWRDKLSIDLNLRPKYWPFNPGLPDRVVIALAASGRVEDFLPKAFAAVFSSEQNLADEEVIASLLASAGLPSKDIIAAAKNERVSAAYEENLAKAVASGVFGAPSYVLNGEVFWGQDRLACLDEALTSGRKPYLTQAEAH